MKLQTGLGAGFRELVRDHGVIASKHERGGRRLGTNPIKADQAGSKLGFIWAENWVCFA